MEDAKGLGIGDRLRAARERAGFSREALAFHSGMSWSAIAQAESGRRTNLRPATLAALAKALGVTIDYLVSGGATSVPLLERRALVYATDDEFFAVAVPFLVDAVDRSEAAIAVTSRAKLLNLRRRLGARAEHVLFADRNSWYQSPVSALEGYQRFFDHAIEAGAHWVRILGEPVWSGRSASDILRWARYESLLGLAFGARPVTVLCPYDQRALDPAVIEYVLETRPQTVERDELAASPSYADRASFVLTS